MTMLNIKPLAACLLVAVSMSARPALAEGLRVGAPTNSSNPYELSANAGGRIDLSDHAGSGGARDDWAALGHTGFSHVNVDVSGRDLSAGALEVAMGPQYPLNRKVTLGGEWENFHALGLDGYTPVDAYHFAVRVAF